MRRTRRCRSRSKVGHTGPLHALRGRPADLPRRGRPRLPGAGDHRLPYRPALARRDDGARLETPERLRRDERTGRRSIGRRSSSSSRAATVRTRCSGRRTTLCSPSIARSTSFAISASRTRRTARSCVTTRSGHSVSRTNAWTWTECAPRSRPDSLYETSSGITLDSFVGRCGAHDAARSATTNRNLAGTVHAGLLFTFGETLAGVAAGIADPRDHAFPLRSTSRNPPIDGQRVGTVRWHVARVSERRHPSRVLDELAHETGRSELNVHARAFGRRRQNRGRGGYRLRLPPAPGPVTTKETTRP